MPAGGMARRCRGDLNGTDGVLLPPFELCNLFSFDAPVFQMGTDAERDDESRCDISQLTNRGFIEVIVVIMADQDSVERRQICQRQRWIVPATWPQPQPQLQPQWQLQS